MISIIYVEKMSEWQPSYEIRSFLFVFGLLLSNLYVFNKYYLYIYYVPGTLLDYTQNTGTNSFCTKLVLLISSIKPFSNYFR